MGWGEGEDREEQTRKGATTTPGCREIGQDRQDSLIVGLDTRSDTHTQPTELLEPLLSPLPPDLLLGEASVTKHVGVVKGFADRLGDNLVRLRVTDRRRCGCEGVIDLGTREGRPGER